MKTCFVLGSVVLLVTMVFHISYGDETSSLQYVNDIGSGDEKKAHEAMEKIEKDRKELISGLVEILEENKELDKPDLVAVKYALLALGRIKAQEAVETIIPYVDFAVKGPKDNPERMEDGVWTPVHERYPATAALHEIGPAVVDDLLDAVAKDRLSTIGVKNVGYLIVGLLGDDGEAAIQSHASKLSSKEEKARLLVPDLLKYYK